MRLKNQRIPSPTSLQEEQKPTYCNHNSMLMYVETSVKNLATNPNKQSRKPHLLQQNQRQIILLQLAADSNKKALLGRTPSGAAIGHLPKKVIQSRGGAPKRSPSSDRAHSADSPNKTSLPGHFPAPFGKYLHQI